MTDALNEQLSACLDGELPPAELDLLLKRVGREAELRAAIGRYSLIGEALRERPAVASRDFAGNVMAALAQEPALVRPSRISAATLRYLRPAAGMAIAAGVAAVAVLSLQPVDQPDLDGAAAPMLAATQSANESTAAVDSDSSYVVPTSTSNPAFIPGTRLTNYVVAHSEYSSPLGRRSVQIGVLADDTQTEIEDTESPVEISIDNSDPER
jgi:sigma-E factor negative regulatory protein RseA